MGGKTLPVREDAKNGVVIPGLSLHKVKKLVDSKKIITHDHDDRQ